jgi:hypothetical protein
MIGSLGAGCSEGGRLNACRGDFTLSSLGKEKSRR